jgi:exodeoxyribonuclease VII large subunit
MAGVNFWDFADGVRKQKESARRGAGDAKRAAGADQPLTVTQLTAIIDKALRAGVPAVVTVQGEASNFKLHGGSGHAYFTLKDSTACIDCVMFRDDAAAVKFSPADGMELVATGRVAVYAQRGRYQLYVTSLAPLGQGALELARQQILAKLQAEGLFDPRRKKPIPGYPLRIALVTSKETAAIQDIYKVLRRYAFLSLLVCHVPVQGDGSAEKISDAISGINRSRERLGGVDVMIVARGGGSLEDLWEFNEECVARAIAGSRIPVITGIGHEIDVSIADLAADYHAHTPTEAAQVATQLWRGARDLLDAGALRLRRELRAIIQDARQRLAGIERHECFRRPLDGVNQLRQVMDDRQRQMTSAMDRRLLEASQRLGNLDARMQERHPRNQLRLAQSKVDAMAGRLARSACSEQTRRGALVESLLKRLDALNPRRVLRRGYSITSLKRGGAVIRSASQVKPGDALVTRLADGQIESVVEDTRQLKLFE